MLQTKVAEAVALIRRHVRAAERPVVLSSFGKDSMVLLALVKLAGLKLPIIFLKEPFFPKKYAFANSVIAAEGYTVYDYPPNRTAVTKNGSVMEIISYHATGGRELYLPTGITPPRGDEPFLCGLNDIYLKPTCANYDFPWDLLLIGHKSSDVDPIMGEIPLNRKVAAGRPILVFPIADFTDADVWAFTVAAGLPINRDRYDASNGWKEFADQTWNPDYFPACTACIDRDRGPKVYCPKVDEMVPNLSGQVTYVTQQRPEYLAETVNA